MSLNFHCRLIGIQDIQDSNRQLYTLNNQSNGNSSLSYYKGAQFQRQNHKRSVPSFLDLQQLIIQSNNSMNNQQITKIINFYRVNYNYHQPYRLIIDGNFLKLLVQKQLVEKLSKWIQNLAHGKVKLYTTHCIQKQLEIFGSLFHLVHDAAKKMKKVSCGHKDIGEGGAGNCIFNFLSKTQQKYILCTQDIELRRKIRNTKNIPLMYFGPDQRITMEDIQKKTVKNLQQQIKDRMLPKANELQPIKQMKIQQWKKQKQAEKQKIIKNAYQQGLKAKTKITKGPNPLSIKKKKKHSSNKQEMNINHQYPHVDQHKTKKILKKNKKSKNNKQQQ